MLERIRKWLALGRYRGNLGYFLVARYGRERSYTPAQVLTTIRIHGLNEPYAAYACAMFCSKAAYASFAASVTAQTFPQFASSIPLPPPEFVADWPDHHDAIAELCSSFGLADPSSAWSTPSSTSYSWAAGYGAAFFTVTSLGGGGFFGGGSDGGGFFGGSDGGGFFGGSDGGGGYSSGGFSGGDSGGGGGSGGHGGAF